VVPRLTEAKPLNDGGDRGRGLILIAKAPPNGVGP